MAEEPQGEETEAPKKGLLGLILVPGIVGVVALGLGIAITVLCPGVFGLQKSASAESSEAPTFVYSFGDVVANLNEGRMNRYLRLGVSMMVEGDAKMEQEFTDTVEKKKPLLTSWLLGYLAELNMEDVRGAAGQNRLRREIHNAFNEKLFPDGNDHIHEVLFEEFSIQ